MLMLNKAVTTDVPEINRLATQNHILLSQNIDQGFIWTLSHHSVLEHIINEGVSKMLKIDDEMVGYILVSSEKGYANAYGKELGNVVEQNYKTNFTPNSAIILQALLEKSLRKRINTITLQNELTKDLLKEFKMIYAEGCLNPFNARTYYLLSEICGWRRSGFQHYRPETYEFDQDSRQLEDLGGLEKLRNLFPKGVVFGLYSIN